jgi:hypothetical protein
LREDGMAATLRFELFACLSAFAFLAAVVIGAF